MADRSTAAVGVASEGGEASLAAQQSGATSDGTTTDDQTNSTSGGARQDAPKERQTPTTAGPAKKVTNPAATTTADRATAVPATDEPPTEVIEAAKPTDPGDPDPEDATTGSPAGMEQPDRAEGEAAAGEADATPSGAPRAEAVTDATAKIRVAKSAATKPSATKVGAAKVGAAKSVSPKAGGPKTGAAKPVAAKSGSGKPSGTSGTGKQPKARSTPPELHSGHKLARRYQLAECVTRVDGFSSWRAVDEKLRRAVGIHILPADHPRARQVLSAARSAALLGDPRFVQVLDAVDENDLVYVIHEWLPDAISLADLLTTGPLEPHEAYQMVSQVSQGMAAAHREGLAHLRLDPGAVLRTVSGQYRIRGLAVAAALRGLTSERPQLQDTEAIGALLYAALTQRWPYEEDAHGLAGLPKGVGLVAPDQVRAGVHRGLSELAMRALVNDGATASREEPPCTTPEELAKAVAGLPRIRPPEHEPPVYQPTVFQQTLPPVGGAGRPPVAPPLPPPALPGRTGQVLKWAVSALLIVAIGLGSWQLADTLKSREDQSTAPTPTGQKAGKDPAPPKVGPVKIVKAKDFDPLGDGDENSSLVTKAFDGDPSTFWQTSGYAGADFGRLKAGVGLILDLGRAHHIGDVKVDFAGGDTSVQLMVAPSGTSTMPTALDGFAKVASGSGTQVTLTVGTKVTSRYLLVWLTKLPLNSDGHFNFRGQISEISVTG